MSYSEELKKGIEASKLSHIEISERCKALGESIVPSYISKLANSEMPPPKDSKTKVLAQVLGIDSRKLFLEAYLDKAPSEIIDFLNNARFSMFSVVFKAFGNTMPKEIFEKLQEQLSNLPLSDFLIQINEFQKNATTSLNDSDLTFSVSDNLDNMSISLKDPIGIPINDNSMFPVIPEGSQVTLEIKNKYSDGDILCISKNEGKSILIRKCFFKDDVILLCPINTGFESEMIKVSDVTILGRVRKIVKEI